MRHPTSRPGEIHRGDHRRSHPDLRTSAVLARLALGRAGIVSHQRALDAGLGAGALQWQLRTGGLHLIHHGVYSVGHRDLSDEAWYYAALEAGGSLSGISHWTSFRRWRLLDGIPLHPVHITLPREEHHRRRRGITAHRPLELHPLDITEEAGPRTTTVPRALLEMAPYLPDKRIALALHRAQVEHRMPLDALRATMERAPRARGLKRLHAVAFGAGIPPNRRERRFLKIVLDAGLPRPLNNALLRVEGWTFLVDFLWPAHRLVYEIDDPSHGTTHRMVGDRRQDAILGDADYRTRRATDEDLWGPGVQKLIGRLTRQLG